MKNVKNPQVKVDEKFDFTKITTLENVLKRAGISDLPDMSNIFEPLRKPLMETFIVMLIIHTINNGWLPDFTKPSPKYYLYFWVRSDGSGFSISGYDCVIASAHVGSRLYIESEEKARHILKYFEKEFENYHLSK